MFKTKRVALSVNSAANKPYWLIILVSRNRRIAGDPSAGTESETKFGIDGGAGVEFKLGGIRGYLEGRLENVYTDKGFTSAFRDKNSTQVIPVTFGFMY